MILVSMANKNEPLFQWEKRNKGQLEQPPQVHIYCHWQNKAILFLGLYQGRRLG